MVLGNQSSLSLLPRLPQAHQLDPTKHYLRLKFLIENQVQFYIPKPEEDVCDLVRFVRPLGDYLISQSQSSL